MRTTTTGPGRAGDPVVEVHHDTATGTATYLVSDPATRRCALVDSVLGFDAGSGRTTTGAADRWIDRILGRGLVLEWILETHVHADHLSAAHYLKSRLGGRICAGAHVAAVRENFAAVFDDPGRAASGEGRFDHLFADGDEFRIGGVPVRVMHTPGHTPACVSYVVGEGGTDVFVGDTLFAPEAGTARCDFPGGDARVLFHSIQRLLALPDATRGTVPAFEHYVPPVIRIAGADVRVFMGSLLGSESPAAAFSPLVGAQIDLDPFADVELPVDPAFEHGVLLDSGELGVDGDDVPRSHLAYREPGAAVLRLTAGADGARLLLIGGTPFGERIVMWWNFIGRTHDEIVGFRDEWMSDVVGGVRDDGRFGVVTGYAGRPLPAPELPGVRLKPRG